jgi:hypothetical protein
MADLPEGFYACFVDFWFNAWVEADIYTALGMLNPPWVKHPQHRLVDSGQVMIDRQQHAEVSRLLCKGIFLPKYS